MATKTITLTTTSRTNINHKLTRSEDGYIFWVDSDMFFTEKQSPLPDEQIPITSGSRFKFNKPTGFYVKGTIGSIVFLSPFDK